MLPTKTEKSIRVFISYSSDDGVVAGKVKFYLQTYFGLEVFLAHEDIEGGEEFENSIIENLKSTDFFIALLSLNFESSEFTDQEVGGAYVLGKRIIPVSIINGFIPYGFIKKIQATKLSVENDNHYEWMRFAEKIISIISRDSHHGQNIKNLIINAFGKSDSFEVSNNFIQILRKYEPYDSQQISIIINSLCRNSTNWNELYHLPPFISKFVKKYKDRISLIDKEELDRYLRLHSSLQDLKL